MAAAQPLRSKKHIKQMVAYYLKKGQYRNYLLVLAGIHTALRISDLLRLKWADVYDLKRDEPLAHIYLTESKTGKPKCIAINKVLARALRLCAANMETARPGEYVFRSNRRAAGRPISRIQAYRIIREAALSIGLAGTISCHSLRKTFGYHAWKTGVPVAVIMDIYNHTSYAVTRRYLGVAQDDRDRVYRGLTLL